MPKPTATLAAPSAVADILEEHLEHCLSTRRQHVEAITAIDAVLSRVYTRLSEDVPTSVPEQPATVIVASQPTPDVSEPGAARALAPVSKPTHDARTRVSVEADAQHVLKAILAGVTQPRQIGAQANLARHRLRAALLFLESKNRIERSGTTRSRRYRYVTEKAPTRVAGPSRRVVAEGVELESVWSGQKTDFSLLGERTTRERVTA